MLSSSDANAVSRGPARQRAERRRQLLAHRPVAHRRACFSNAACTGAFGSARNRSDSRTAFDAHVARRVVERLDHRRRVEAVEAVERPQRVQPGARIGAPMSASFFSAGDDAPVAALDQQLLRRVAPPAVRMDEPPDQLRRRLGSRAPAVRRAASCRARSARCAPCGSAPRACCATM